MTIVDLTHVLVMETVVSARRAMTAAEVAMVTPVSIGEAEAALRECVALGALERAGAGFRVCVGDRLPGEAFALRDTLKRLAVVH